MLPLARAFIASRLKKRVGDGSHGLLLLVRTLLDATTRIFMIAVAVYLAMRWLKVPEKLDGIIGTTLLVIIWWQIGHWASAAVRYLIDARRGHELSGTEGAASVNILRFVGILVVWIVAFLMLLTNLGVRIMPLVAGLGIGGIAVALAVQNLLGDLFASLSIALDKPFRVGDSLAVGDDKGTVEQVGIKSTRLRSVTGEQIVMSNGDILKSRLRNYGLLPERRAELQLRIAYETPRPLIEEIAEDHRDGDSRREKDAIRARAFRALRRLCAAVRGGVFRRRTANYKVFMDTQQAINLRLLDEFARRGITLAYPTSRSMSIPPPSAAPQQAG